MDVLERKPAGQYKDDLKRIIKLLTYKKNKLELKGSSSLTSQRFFSDYDLFCVVEKPVEAEFVKFLQDTLQKIKDSDDLWFIELKLQTKGKRPKKIRVFPNQTLKEADVGKVWEKLDIVKLDLIARMENRFTEVSVIYSFTPTVPTKEEYIQSLNDDIRELRKEKKYYKILKRQFNIAKSNDDKKELLRLSKIFNSEMGQEYQTISNLEAIAKVLEFHQEPKLFEKVVVNLKDLHEDPSVASAEKIEEWVKERSKDLNSKAKKLL
jgi:hypothetical protein